MTPGWPAELEVGLAGAAHGDAARSGDLAVLVPSARGALVAVIDGLGHGVFAADAADTAAEVLRAHPDDPPQELLERCHAALRRTRGVVMTLAWFDVRAGTLAWTGVGNVEARLVRATGREGARYESPVVLGGVVGYKLPRVRMGTVDIRPGDAIVLATDGVSADYSTSVEPSVPAQALADRLLEQHGRGTDDALVLVIRYTRPAGAPDA